jgi:hypothetical protein
MTAASCLRRSEEAWLDGSAARMHPLSFRDRDVRITRFG